jgi:hypothetical protein
MCTVWRGSCFMLGAPALQDLQLPRTFMLNPCQWTEIPSKRDGQSAPMLFFTVTWGAGWAG